MTDKITYEQFMKKVDEVLSSRLGGLTHSDLVDAQWRDFYDDCQDLADSSEFPDAIADVIDDAGEHDAADLIRNA